MKSDPFYVKDSLSSQFDNEDKMREQKRLEFMEQQKKDYLEYLKMKDNKRTGTPFKITEDEQYHPPIKKLDNQYSNLCTNIAKDNQYSRAGYQINNWKIPDKYEKNFDENYIRGKHRSGYNIINHQIYDNKEMENKRMNPSLRKELELYEKNLKNQFQNLNINENKPNIYYENNQMNQINNNDINQRNNYNNYPKQQEYPNLNQQNQNNETYQNYERQPQQNQFKRVYNNNNDIQQEIPKENENKYIQQIKEEQEYRNYLEYIKKKELMEKEKEYEEYLRQKEQNLQMEKENQKQKEQYNYSNNPNIQKLPNFHNFINTAEDYKNKQTSYIDQYADNLEKQRQEMEYKRQQAQKVLTKENMELYAEQQKRNNYKNDISQLPFDRFQEEREEYFSNKKKNVSTYSNLTSMTTTNPSLKNDPNVQPYIDPEKAYENKIKEEKMNKYRRELDEQIRNRPQEAYGKINNDRRIEVPPDPCKLIYFYY